MKRILYPIFALIFLGTGTLEAATPEEILSKLDRNTFTSSIKYTAQLQISLSGKLVKKEFKGYVQGQDKAYMEFVSPKEDSGKRFLKIKDTLWMYLPSVGKATRFSGAAAKGSFMGSDFSYGDAVENAKLAENYYVTLDGEETVRGVKCYILKLTLKPDKEGSYFMRRIWVSKDDYSYLKAEYYSKSVTLLKTIDVLESKKIGSQYYPTHVRMENKLRKDTWTEFKISDVQIGISIPPNVFTRQYLEK